MAVFNDRMVAERVQPFWAASRRGEFITDAAAEVGTYRKKGTRWVAAAGGVRPRRGRDLKGRCLAFSEREEIALARARGESMRCIARRLGKSPSTVSRELRRNADRCGGGYRATTAHALAHDPASRPKPAKLATNRALRPKVEQDPSQRYSPEQIAGRLRVEFPDQPEMWVSTETIYQSLYVQSRGALRRELTKCLRTGRALRQPCRRAGQRKNRIPEMVNISKRPPSAACMERPIASGVPMSVAAAWAISSLRSEISPDTLRSTLPRSATGVCDQSSKARRAAATARSTSSTVPLGTCATTAAVVGLTTSIVASSVDATHSPSTRGCALEPVRSGGSAYGPGLLEMLGPCCPLG